MLRILIIDKTAGLAASHERHQAIAGLPDIELHVLGPKHWIENGREVIWQPPLDTAYTVHYGKVFFKDKYARAAYYSGLTHALKGSKPDIIQLLEEPWSFTAAQTLVAAKLYAPQAKLLFYTWENIERGWNYPSRGAFLYRIIDQAMHNYSHGAVCATQQAEQVLQQKGFMKPTSAISYGIPDFFLNTPSKSEPSNDTFTIGYVGRLLRMKGVDLLLQAVKTIPTIKLMIIGSGSDEDQFQSLAKSLGINERVQWIQPVNENELPAYLHQMDVLLLPSRTTPGWKEQLGRVVIEAMAVGVPVIGSSSGAIPEVIGDAGMIFKEDDVDDLRMKIQQLINSPELSEQMANDGKLRVNQYFKWSIFAESLISFYRNKIV